MLHFMCQMEHPSMGRIRVTTLVYSEMCSKAQKTASPTTNRAAETSSLSAGLQFLQGSTVSHPQETRTGNILRILHVSG